VQIISEKSKSMGGFGSGRPKGSGRDTIDSCRALNVNRLYRSGCLAPGWFGVWQWSDGQQTASITLRAEADRVILSYRFHGGTRSENVYEPVPIVRMPCRFGGFRPYFLCLACRRRVVTLFESGGYFKCRHCSRLAYASQREDAWHRSLRRAGKIHGKLRERLGPEPGFSDRPKGMWCRTYGRLIGEAFAASMIVDDALVLRLEELMAKID
jgi:hypothetical protein